MKKSELTRELGIFSRAIAKLSKGEKLADRLDLECLLIIKDFLTIALQEKLKNEKVSDWNNDNVQQEHRS